MLKLMVEQLLQDILQENNNKLLNYDKIYCLYIAFYCYIYCYCGALIYESGCCLTT